MSEYERSTTVPAPPDRVFEFVSNPDNLPQFLPTLKDATIDPDGKLHVRGQANGQGYDAEGFFRTDQAQRRMEWGAEAEHSYNGWLRVDEDGGGSRVTVHLSFSPRNEAAEQIGKETGDRDAAIRDSMDRTLEKIRELATNL